MLMTMKFYTLQHLDIVDEPEPIPQHADDDDDDDDDSLLEQQLGEMNVARGRTVEAVQKRLELAHE